MPAKVILDADLFLIEGQKQLKNLDFYSPSVGI